MRMSTYCINSALSLSLVLTGCKARTVQSASAVANAEETTSQPRMHINLTPDQTKVLRDLGFAVIMHLAAFHQNSFDAVAAARCQGCSRPQRLARLKEMLRLARSPKLDALVDRAIGDVLPDVLEQVLAQTGGAETRLDEAELLKIFNQVDTLKDLAALLTMGAGIPTKWSQYFASLAILRAAAAEELQKDDINQVDWQMVQESTSVVTQLFVLNPYDLTPFPLTIKTDNPAQNVTYRALFFARGANLWLSSVLVQHVLDEKNPPPDNEFDEFDLTFLPEGMPPAVYDRDANYSTTDRATLRAMRIVLTQLELEPEKAKVVKGLKMLALGIRYGKLHATGAASQ